MTAAPGGAAGSAWTEHVPSGSEVRLRIKSLQITGFKSFVDKTAFSFEPGITAIVGPNGCGKSNVVDAIRWVMGEQSPRRLRGKGMEDVIFAGSDARAPVGVAEVVLTFDNADGRAPAEFALYSEIQVARRLYRSGESEYLLNKTPCRLREIQDFFRDTGVGTKGYTIVEQGRIAEIVSAKPDERRILIEEAAGISKFKARRREAERKLEATEQNLTRVRDILGEIQRQVHSIERQARKAARYKRWRYMQRLLELSLAADERRALLGELEQARAGLAAVQDSLTRTEAQLAEREALLEQRRLELAERERTLGQGNEELFQLRGRIKELEGRIGFERRERASLAELRQARQVERQQLEEQLAGMREEEAGLREEQEAVEASLAQELHLLEQAEGEARTAREGLAALEQEREGENQALVQVLTEIARAEDRAAAVADRRAELDQRLQAADEVLSVQQVEAARVDRQQRDLEEGLRNLLAERDRLMSLLSEALRRFEAASERARELRGKLAARRELRETRRARLASLRELLEGREDLGAAARHLLGLDAEQRASLGLRGLVRDVLEVDRAFERAVEAVLAERAQGLVVEGGSEALAALAALRRAGVGGGLLVLQRDAPLPSRGFVPLGKPLLGFVRPRAGFEGVVHSLLGAANLVESLGEALDRYGPGGIPCTFVTRAGDLLTPEGTLRGGGGPGRPGLLTWVREVRELEGEVADLDTEVASLERGHQAAEQALGAAGDELDNLRSRHHTAALAVANHEKDLERTRERVKALGEAQGGRVAERSDLLAEASALEEEAARLAARLEQAREERAVRQRVADTLGLRIGSSRRELARLEAAATERRVQHAGREEVCQRLRAERMRGLAQVRETEGWIQRREAEIRSAEEGRAALARSIEAAEAELARLLEEEERARARNEGERDAYERQAAAVRELEEGARSIRIDLEAQRDEAQQAELALRERELRLQHLEDGVRDRWSVDLASWKPPAPALAPEPGAGAGGMEAEASEGEPLPAEGTAPESSPAGPAEDRDARREAQEMAALLALDAGARRARLEETRKRIESMGEVNLGAIEEYEELRERFRFLSEQKGDLESSVGQLRDAIARINRTSRKRFRETFEAVNGRFRENFPRLFRGGKASLALTESEDVLEAGIEILVQPPGKRLQQVSLLSGGEKTMTAIALLVSVFQVRPSPSSCWTRWTRPWTMPTWGASTRS